MHQDGLVHISQMSDDFVKNPADVLKVGQRVQATVMEIDMPRKRIALSLKTKVEIGPRGDRQAEAGQRDVQRFTGSGAGAKPSGSPAPDWFTLAQQKRS